MSFVWGVAGFLKRDKHSALLTRVRETWSKAEPVDTRRAVDVVRQEKDKLMQREEVNKTEAKQVTASTHLMLAGSDQSLL